MDALQNQDFHTYEPSRGHGLKHDPFLAIVGPRPIGWISSVDSSGRTNLAPYSFFNAFCDDPPIIGFCSNGWKDTVANISQTKQFTWNLASRRLAAQMNLTATSLQHGSDEFELAGLAKTPGALVKAPRVAQSPVSFECFVTQIVQLHGHGAQLVPAWMVFGEVVTVHIDRRFIQDGVYHTTDGHPVLRGGGAGEFFEIHPESGFRMAYPANP
jgi:flavin reductase (DIM6/NTAB) family NADH-FMN oxidoreductase RutF